MATNFDSLDEYFAQLDHEPSLSADAPVFVPKHPETSSPPPAELKVGPSFWEPASPPHMGSSKFSPPMMGAAPPAMPTHGFTTSSSAVHVSSSWSVPAQPIVYHQAPQAQHMGYGYSISSGHQSAGSHYIQAPAHMEYQQYVPTHYSMYQG